MTTNQLVRSKKVVHNLNDYLTYQNDHNYTTVEYDHKSGGMMAVHKSHEMHERTNEEHYFEGLTAGELELRCGKQLMQAGYKVVFANETKKYLTPNGTLGVLPQLDITIDGKPVDISSVTHDGWFGGNILTKNKQLGKVKKKTGVESDSVLLYFYRPEYFTPERMANAITYYKNFKKDDGTPLKARIKHVLIVRHGVGIEQYDI